MKIDIIAVQRPRRFDPLPLALFGIIILCIIAASSFLQPYYENGPTICLFKNAFNIPCPGCGMTRALLFLAHGEIHRASVMNPNSILVFFIFSGLLFNAACRVFLKKEIAIHFSGKEKMILYIFSAIIMICGWVYNLTLNPFA